MPGTCMWQIGCLYEQVESNEQRGNNSAILSRAFPRLPEVLNTLFLQIGVSMSSLFSGTDRISLR